MPDYDDYVLRRSKLAISQKFADLIGKAVDADVSNDDIELREIPEKVKDQSSSRIDYAVALHPFAAKHGVNPVELAKQLKKELNEQGGDILFNNFEVAGPYVNIGLNKVAFMREFLSEYSQLGSKYGTSNVTSGNVIVIDFSSPNIAKPFGINHMRSTDIGEALSRIYELTGAFVVRDNHYGDWGTQFGNLLSALERWAPEVNLTELSLPDLREYYVRFSQEKKDDPELVESGRETFLKLSEGDNELLERWKTLRDISLKEFHKVYERLGIAFNIEVGEAYFATEANEIVDELVGKKELAKQNVLEVDEDSDAVIIPETEDEKLRPTMLRTSDGYTVYAARDLATIKFRTNELNADRAIYVVGNEQEVNFEQVFRLVKKAGLNKNMQLEHAGFGLLLGKDGKKLSTRKGTSGDYQDLLDEAVEKARSELERRKAEDTEFYDDFTDEEINETAEAIGKAAIIWTDLQSRRRENVKLDIDQMLQLQEGSSLYVQYAYTRALSLLAKAAEAGHDVSESIDVSEDSELTDIELDVALLIASYPSVLQEAAENNEPSVVADYLQEFATKYNKLYASVKVLGTEHEPTLQARLALHNAAKETLGSAMRALNLPVVNRL